MPLTVVAIVGRPNVGKSTLFNRITRSRSAVVDPEPGVTRDRHYAEAEWDGVYFTLVDTGGYLPVGTVDELASSVTEQTLIASQESDFVLFMADVQTGITEIDLELARIILKQNVPVVLVANKADDHVHLGMAWELRNTGIGEPIAI